MREVVGKEVMTYQDSDPGYWARVLMAERERSMSQTFDVIVDVDDVIHPWSKTAYRICERAGLTNGQPITQWYFYLDFGCTEEELWAVLSTREALDELYTAPPIPNALTGLRRLRNMGHRVHIVTARGFGPNGDEIQAMTRDWMSEWNVPLDSLTFAKDKTIVPADFALDDGIHNYEALNAAGVHCSLMDAIHNQEYDVPPGRRSYSVVQFADQVLFAASLRGAA